MLRRLPWITLALAASCSSRDGQPARIVNNVALHAVQGCPAVEKAVQDAAVAEMRHRLEAQIHWLSGGVIMRGGGDGSGPAAAGDHTPGPASYTTTNTQVPGVDEPDFVKNDGTRIFVLTGRKLYASSSWPPAKMQLGDALDIEGYPTDMFLDDKGRITVFSEVPPADPSIGIGMGLCPVGMGFRCGYWGPMTTKLTLVDARDAAHLAVSGEVWLPGSSRHSRRVGSQVHVVVTDPPRWPKDVKWWPQNVNWGDAAALTAAIHQLEDANEALIRAQPLGGWLPPVKRKLAGGETVEVPYDCAQFQVGNAPVHLGFLTVATLDLDHPELAPSRSTLVGEGDMVYANAGSLYVAERHWWWWEAGGQDDWTYVHRFDIGRPGGAAYVASGGFAGTPVNQFSLDESGGYLRVAVNTAHRYLVSVGDGPMRHDELRADLSNAVRVLATEGDRLNVIGELNDLSPKEWVMSSRFIGSRAYVVTFRRIDPLFAIDLSDPARPRKAGELQSPGFSTYLHPMDETHLLAIGVDLPGDGPVDWRQRSLQLSVFDVSDISAPKLSARARIGTAWAYSQALWDHHAFTWFAEKKLLAVPFFDWDPTVNPSSGAYWGSFTSDLRVFQIAADSITSKGALTMKDLFVTYGDGNWRWMWSPWIRRSVMASDSAGATFVYAVSDAGIRVADVEQLSVPLATVSFPPQR